MAQRHSTSGTDPYRVGKSAILGVQSGTFPSLNINAAQMSAETKRLRSRSAPDHATVVVSVADRPSAARRHTKSCTGYASLLQSGPT
jgi:hypothetical protein